VAESRCILSARYEQQFTLILFSLRQINSRRHAAFYARDDRQGHAEEDPIPISFAVYLIISKKMLIFFLQIANKVNKLEI
jgi:hypothetical protein